MPSRLRLTRPALRRGALILAAAAVGACSDSTGPDDGADVEIESVRLTVTPPGGGAPVVYLVNANSRGAAPVALRVGTSNIRAEPLDDRGNVVDEAAEFELRMSGLPAGTTLTPTTTLTTTLVAGAATAAPVDVSADMYHRTENHTDYTANFRLTVTP